MERGLRGPGRWLRLVTMVAVTAGGSSRAFADATARETFEANNAAPTHPVASHPTPSCPGGWEAAFERARSASVWIETPFNNGNGILLTSKIAAAPAQLVVLNHGTIRVRLSNETVTDAEVLYVDEAKGLALLQLQHAAMSPGYQSGAPETLPLFAPLLSVRQPNTAFDAPASQTQRNAPSLAVRGNRFSDSTFGLGAGDTPTSGTAVFGCDARFYGLVIERHGELPRVLPPRALEDALAAAEHHPFAGPSPTWGGSVFVGTTVGPTANFGLATTLDVVQWRRARLVASVGTVFSRYKGGTFGDFALGTRFPVARGLMLLDAELGGGVAATELKANGTPCVQEGCEPARVASRGYALGRVKMNVGYFTLGYTLRVNPIFGFGSHVVSFGVGYTPELQTAVRNR